MAKIRNKQYCWAIIGAVVLIGAGILIWQLTKNHNQSQSQTQNNPASTNQSQPNTQSQSQKPALKFAYPVANFTTGQTKKHFGQYITPATSPVQPERFTGYHTGVDVEQEQNNNDIPVYAIAGGTVRYVNYVSGYGGVIVIEFKDGNQTYTALYGHIRLSSAAVSVGDKVTKGEKLAVLGKGYSSETNGERKHLHFSIHKTASIELRGYVQNKSDLSGWRDPNSLY